eukprot:jgi/Mesvir1/26719/Mv20496-RA.1
MHVWDIINRPDYASWVENMPTNHGGSVKFNKAGKMTDWFDGRSTQYLYIPLEFAFTCEPGTCFPMIALSFHEVRIKVKFATADKIFTSYSLSEPSYDTVPGVIGGTVKSTLNTSGSPDYNLIRSIIRSRYIDSAYGNQMAQLISETGDRKWVKHVIENAMYTDKITNIHTATTPPSGTTDGTLEISFQIADYNASIGSTRTFVISDSMIPKADKFTPTFTTVAANQRAAWAANPPTFTTRLVGRYVYLDDYERQQFASETHEFLMTENQLHTQYVGGQEQVTIDLKFNHPVKELLFFYRPDDWSDSETTLKGYYKGYWSFKNPNSRFGEGHLFKTANLILNSQNMYGDGKDPVYFSYVVPTQFHKRMDTDHNVYIIPFCLDPGSCKPTGSVNMSRLDDVKLVLTGLGGIPAGTISVYARNFNLLSVQSGMGGKRYAS